MIGTCTLFMLLWAVQVASVSAMEGYSFGSVVNIYPGISIKKTAKFASDCHTEGLFTRNTPLRCTPVGDVPPVRHSFSVIIEELGGDCNALQVTLTLHHQDAKPNEDKQFSKTFRFVTSNTETAVSKVSFPYGKSSLNIFKGKVEFLGIRLYLKKGDTVAQVYVLDNQGASSSSQATSFKFQVFIYMTAVKIPPSEVANKIRNQCNKIKRVGVEMKRTGTALIKGVDYSPSCSSTSSTSSHFSKHLVAMSDNQPTVQQLGYPAMPVLFQQSGCDLPITGICGRHQTTPYTGAILFQNTRNFPAQNFASKRLLVRVSNVFPRWKS